ncbi:hypothetical protein JTB14_021303 [Gonioctena quinquepunctata]|nr:hypothetical protein JTB14_021303 [Gonioctena quinquepunctata]
MPACCVPYCKNRSDKGIRCFAVPQSGRNKERRDQWQKHIKRDVLPINAFVCEKHFTEDQFENKRLDKKRPLKRTAIPTLFPDEPQMHYNIGKKEIKDEVEIEMKKFENNLAIIEQAERKTIFEKKFIKCRTCLEDKNTENCSVMKKLLYGKTIKQMMIECVPQMSSTITDDNYICDKCLRCLLRCVKFIDSCLEVEARIQNEKLLFGHENTVANEEVADYDKSGSSDLQNQQNNLEVQGKRKRKTKKIENSADDEEIEAYLAEVCDKSSEKSFELRKERVTAQNVVNDEIHETSVTGKPTVVIRRKKRENVRKREVSPKMEIVDKALGMVIRTYERKKPADNRNESKNEASIEIGNVSVNKNYVNEEYTEESSKVNIRTYQRKRNSTTKNNNEELKYIFNDFQISKPCDIDCDNDRFANRIIIEHDYIIQSDSVENIASLNENGEILCSKDLGDENLSGNGDETKLELKCPSCQTHYKTRRGLRDHLEIVHKIKDEECMFSCQVCNEEFIIARDMLKHKRTHGLPCHLCGEIFQSNEELTSHKKAHPPNYSCIECGDKFKTESKLMEHSTMHKLMIDLEKTQFKAKLPPKRFNCDLCSMVFRFPTRLRVHKNIVHLKLKEHKCTECGKMFGSRGTLAVHYKVKHQDDRPFQCDVCGASFKRRDYLKNHTIIHHLELRQLIPRRCDITKQEKFPCDFCGMELKNTASLKKHLNTHVRIRRFSCNFCGLKFLHQRTKFVHERSHNVDPHKKFICPICWKRISTKEELDEHTKRHVGTLKKYKCRLCSKAFSRQMLLENHILEAHSTEQAEENSESASTRDGEGSCEDICG